MAVVDWRKQVGAVLADDRETFEALVKAAKVDMAAEPILVDTTVAIEIAENLVACFREHGTAAKLLIASMMIALLELELAGVRGKPGTAITDWSLGVGLAKQSIVAQEVERLQRKERA